MHHKVPTNDNLMTRGVPLPSMCSSCNSQGETDFHLFFQCPFAMNLWNLLFSILNTSIQFNTVEDFWLLLDRNWSPQCKLVIKACIVNLLNIIWLRRNQARFQGKIIHWKSAINLIIAKTSLADNNTLKTSRGDMLEFSILKACKLISSLLKLQLLKKLFGHLL